MGLLCAPSGGTDRARPARRAPALFANESQSAGRSAPAFHAAPIREGAQIGQHDRHRGVAELPIPPHILCHCSFCTSRVVGDLQKGVRSHLCGFRCASIPRRPGRGFSSGKFQMGEIGPTCSARVGVVRTYTAFRRPRNRARNKKPRRGSPGLLMFAGPGPCLRKTCS